MKYVFPENYGNDCVLLPIDVSLIPLVSGALKPFEERYKWATELDYERGYNAFAQIQEELMGNCMRQLIESNNKLYRLIDSVFNGVEYSATYDETVPGNYIVTPEIPVVPLDLMPYEYRELGVRGRLERAIYLLDNLITGKTTPYPYEEMSSGALEGNKGIRETITDMQGIINAGWFGIGGQPATLANIIEALRMGNENDVERVTTALDVLVGASSTASIFDTVRGLFTETAEVGAEGAILGTLIASAMAQAAMLGIMSGQIETLNENITNPNAPQSILDELGAIRSQLENNPAPNTADILDRLDTVIQELS